MIILIAGATHSGKTMLSQKLLEKYKFPYLSIDHLKMGLIRSGNTLLTSNDDQQLLDYLWPIVKEIIKTAIENSQNLIIEGCYIPFHWKDSFDENYQKEISYYCLIMTSDYINKHYEDIKGHENDIEHRKADTCPTKEKLIHENMENLRLCKQNDCNYILIDRDYSIDISL